MKKILAFAFIIVGTVVGAGFATGREVSQYFARFGYVFVPCSLLAGFLFYFFYVFLLKTSREKRFQSYQDFSKQTFGRAHSLFDAFLGISFLILCGSMYASINQVQKILIDVKFPIFSLITAILCVLVCLRGLSGLAKANLLTTPPIIILIIIICIKGIIAPPYSGNFEVGMSAVPLGVTSCIIYVAMNFLLAGVFLLLIGNKYSRKQSRYATLISVILLVFILMLICICLLSNANIMNEELPLLILSFSFSKLYGYMFCIIIWGAIFSTLVSASFSCLNILSSKKHFLTTFIVIAISYFISSLGFTEIVKYIYPLIGAVGIVFMWVVFARFGNGRFIIFSINKNHYKRKAKKSKLS